MSSRQPRLFARLDMDRGEILRCAGGSVAVISARSPDKTTDNEDAAFVIDVDEDRGVLAVADGVGGQPAGADAAGLALRTLSDCVLGGNGSVRSAILDGFEQANHRVRALGVNAATTLAAVEIDGRTVRPYHAGDSMILIVGQRGRIRHETISHSPVGYAVASGLLDAALAIHHEDRHVVSNIIGSEEMRIEVGPVTTLQPRDTLVLGTDGLFDNLHLDEIVDAVRKGPLADAALTLSRRAKKRMGPPRPGHPSKPDDLTFILFRPIPLRSGDRQAR